MSPRIAAVLSSTVVAMSLGFACAPIQGSPLSGAPLNTGCPDPHACSAYDVEGSKTKATCEKGRCEAGRPDFAFMIVVNVPDTSFYGPGRTFYLSDKSLSSQTGMLARGLCIPPTCVQLPELVPTEGKYLVTAKASKLVGLPLPEGTSIPVTASFVPLLESTMDEAVPRGLPMDSVITSSRVISKGPERPEEVSFIDAISVGRYRRISYPQPPYDQFFPPAISTLRVSEGIADVFTLGDAKTPLDDENGTSRIAKVTRAEGLEGWRVWLEEGATGRRISSIRTLIDSPSTVRLDTTGQHQPTTQALADDVDVIVAPPDAWIGVPRLQSRVVNGSGLKALLVPPLPAPAMVSGDVAFGEGEGLTGLPSRVIFASSRLRLVDGTLQPLLHYSAVVASDERGHFTTVLPPGLYDVTVEPAEGTRYAKVKDTFDTAEKLAKTFRPPLRTLASGRVLLTDGRPLAEADVLALPSDTAGVATPVKPRPARARTDAAGRFSFEVDQGQYDLVVDPQAGTGFPRVVQLRSFGLGTAEIGDIQVGAPHKLSFKLGDASQVANPIVRALVRVFASPPGRVGPAVEIGRAMTDEQGNCEILLAQQPR